MRIIIEMTEAESHSTTVVRETATRETETQQPSEAANGGSPSEALLAALGFKAETAVETRSGGNGAVDAGQPAAWLLHAASAQPRPG